jgi:hypothetical protein
MKKSRFIFMAVIAIILVLTSVRADQQDYIGEWTNVDPNTSGLTRLILFNDGDTWKIHAWGKCHTEDCDWKTVDLHILGSSVSDKSFKSGFAIWDQGFATRYITLSKYYEELVLEVVTIYREKYRNSRSNTKYSYRMRRIG